MQEKTHLKLIDAALVGSAGAGIYGLARGGLNPLKSAAFLTPYLAAQTWSDVSGLRGSTNARDTLKYGVGLAADVLAITGLAATVARPLLPAAASFGLLALGAALTTRVSSEFILITIQLNRLRVRTRNIPNLF